MKYIKEIINKKSNEIVFSLCIIFVVWMQRNIWSASLGIGLRILELIFTLCMTISLYCVIRYLFIDEMAGDKKEKLLQCYIGLLMVQVIAFLPMYTQNFMYGDDLWGFAEVFDGTVKNGLLYNRPFIYFLYGIIPKLSFFTIKYFRLCNAIFMYFFGCIFLKFVFEKTNEIRRAFVLSTCIIASCMAVDCIAYASIFPINSSLMISAISFIVYQKAKDGSRKERICMVLISGICLLTAFFFYQIGTPIVFVFFVIYEKYSERQKEYICFKTSLLYLIYYGMVACIYLMGNKVLQKLVGVSSLQSARGEFVSTIEEIMRKIDWFFEVVCRQALTRIVAILFGNNLFQESNMFYNCTYKNNNLETLLVTCMIICTIVSILFVGRKHKSMFSMFICIVAIPLTFYPFLILPESYFLTYYAIPLITIFLWYIVDGLIILIRFLKGTINLYNNTIRKKMNFLVGAMVFIVVIQSNFYAETGWVNYCRDSYEFMANQIYSELVKHDSIDTIIVNGNISPYVGGRSYVRHAVNRILDELGENAQEYNVVQQDNEYYLVSFQDHEIEKMIEMLGDEKYQKMLLYYTHDDMYNRYVYNYTAQEQIQKEFLQECFYQTKQLSPITDTTIAIDLTGFYQRNKF